MVNYLYKHRIWFDTTDVIGVDNTQEALDTSDFETNYKSSTIEVDDLEVYDNTFTITKTYSEFKALMNGLTWVDVKTEIGDKFYDLYILTSTPL